MSSVRERGKGLVTVQPEALDVLYEEWLLEQLFAELLKEMS